MIGTLSYYMYLFYWFLTKKDNSSAWLSYAMEWQWAHVLALDEISYCQIPMQLIGALSLRICQGLNLNPLSIYTISSSMTGSNMHWVPRNAFDIWCSSLMFQSSILSLNNYLVDLNFVLFCSKSPAFKICILNRPRCQLPVQHHNINVQIKNDSANS